MSSARRAPRAGRLELILGPMVSGKTSNMVYKLTRLADLQPSLEEVYTRYFQEARHAA